MTASAILAEARRRGIRLSDRDGRLRYEARPGAMTAELRAALAEHKPAVLELLRAEAAPAIEEETWRAELACASPGFREWWAERAAILEFDAGLDRAAAEANAYEDVMAWLATQGLEAWLEANVAAFTRVDPRLVPEPGDGPGGATPPRASGAPNGGPWVGQLHSPKKV